MARVITNLLILAMLTLTSILKAQDTQKKPCSEIEYSQFNFWIGEWNVYDTKDKLIGTSKVLKQHNACALQENWTSASSPSKGTSYSFYKKGDTTWNQVWVDNSGGSLFLKGEFIGNQMILSSEFKEGKNGKFCDRITWSKKSDGSVTQVWDRVATDGSVIQQAFKGIYKKKE